MRMKMVEVSKKILWINYIRAISILFVFFVHSEAFYDFNCGVNAFIHPFYVNAFFFVSGYLLYRKQLSSQLLNHTMCSYVKADGKKMLANVFWRLMIPSLLFSVIEFFPSYMLRGKEYDVGIFLYKTIGGCTYWFTAALAVADVLIFIMLITRKTNIWFYFSVSLIVYGVGYFIVSNDYSLLEAYPSFPWQYKQGMYAIIFMAFGGVYWKYEYVINKFMDKKPCILLLVGVYVTSLVVYPSFFHVLVSTLNLNILGIMLSVISILILIRICKLIPYVHLWNYIGKNTIGFYFMSGALPIVVSIIVKKFYPSPSIAGLLVVFLLSMFIAFCAVFLMNRYASWLFDLRVLWKKEKQ